MIHLNQIAKTAGGQDGAIWGTTLFRFDTKGLCRVYDLSEIQQAAAEQDAAECILQEIGSFVLDRAEEIVPHSNAVIFGREYYEEGDEFPLLYSNIYNNYAKTGNLRKGVCCVYRIQRTEEGFKSTLVQQIEIGFVEDPLWKSGEDVRPYGNFVIDAERGLYWAYVMRDAEHVTRYMAFELPSLADGAHVVLTKASVKECFDCEYHHFIQGGCLHHGRIYSVEGFTNSTENPAGLRIIDTVEQKQIAYVNLAEMGYPEEPEMIDFCGETCYYGDGHGNLYIAAL